MLQGETPSDDHVTLTAELDRDRRSAQVKLGTEGRVTAKMGASVSFDASKRALPYDFDLEAVIAACAEHGTFLEINANPKRLDLAPPAAGLAIEAGVGLLVYTDAHRTTTLDFMRYGVAMARRAWA